MSSIENTEAIIVKSVLGQSMCKISVLAGNIGDTYVRLYQATHSDFNQNILSCPYLGFSFEADARSFYIWVCSTDRNFPLYKGDSIRLKFEDGKFIQWTFPIGGHQVGREKRNIIGISELEVLQLLDYSILEVEVINHKYGITALYKFYGQYNNQYTGEIQGGKLMQLVVKRIVGARQMINTLGN